MDDLVKIGRTKNLRECMVQLSSATRVPVPFECYCACEVSNVAEVEKSCTRDSVYIESIEERNSLHPSLRMFKRCLKSMQYERSLRIAIS